MKIHYCLPVIKSSQQDVRKTIEKYYNYFQFFEIWLEEIIDLEDKFVKELSDIYQNKIIFLFQRGNSKNSNMSRQRKKHVLDLLDTINCFLDLDISETEEIDYLKKNKIRVKTIISYHNYQETPSNL